MLKYRLFRERARVLRVGKCLRSNWRHQETWSGDYTHRLLGSGKTTLITGPQEQHGTHRRDRERVRRGGVDNEIS